MKRLTNRYLEALETAWRDTKPSDLEWRYPAGITGRVHYPGRPISNFQAMMHEALPALLEEVRDFRRLTTPQPISEKHKDGNWWLVWEPGAEGWFKCRWRSAFGDWQKSGTTERLLGTPTHALPLPGRPQPPAPRGEE